FVPEKYVVISPNKNGEGVVINSLNIASASSLFAGKMTIEPWIRKIQDLNYKEGEVVIKKETPTRLWFKEKLKQKSILPLIIIAKNGEKRPFGYNDTLDIDEKIIYIE